MRFSDQIDLGNGALRSWQAESERLLFDHSGRSQWGRREQGEMESHCYPPPPTSQKPAGSHSEVLHHPACSGPTESCSAVTHGLQKHSFIHLLL